MGTELDTTEGTTGTELVRPGGALDEMLDFLRGLPVEDDEAVQERIIRSILRATTLDEVALAGGSTPIENLLNVPMTVHAIHPDESTFTQGMAVYLHLDAELGNGDRLTVSTGSQDIVLKLGRLAQLGLLPCRLTPFRNERPTRNGFYPTFAKIEPANGQGGASDPF